MRYLTHTMWLASSRFVKCIVETAKRTDSLKSTRSCRQTNTKFSEKFAKLNRTVGIEMLSQYWLNSNTCAMSARSLIHLSKFPVSSRNSRPNVCHFSECNDDDSHSIAISNNRSTVTRLHVANKGLRDLHVKRIQRPVSISLVFFRLFGLTLSLKNCRYGFIAQRFSPFFPLLFCLFSFCIAEYSSLFEIWGRARACTAGNVPNGIITGSICESSSLSLSPFQSRDAILVWKLYRQNTEFFSTHSTSYWLRGTADAFAQ